MIDRQFLRTAREEIQNILKDYADKHNLQISLGSASFTSENATFKLELATKAKDGSVNTKKAEDFKLYASMYGLSPDDLDREFNWGGNVYRLIGLSPRANKFPLIVERISNGKSYKMPLESIPFRKDRA